MFNRLHDAAGSVHKDVPDTMTALCVVAAMESGLSCSEAGERFGILPITEGKWTPAISADEELRAVGDRG